MIGKIVFIIEQEQVKNTLTDSKCYGEFSLNPTIRAFLKIKTVI